MKISSCPPYAISILRLVTGLLFSAHGLQKLFGAFGGLGGRGGTVQLFTLLGLAGVLEAAGGILILLGLFSRPVAFLLCGQMAYAYFSTHAPRGFWPIVNGGEPAVLYCFIFLLLWAAGPGPLSLDRLVRRKSG